MLSMLWVLPFTGYACFAQLYGVNGRRGRWTFSHVTGTATGKENTDNSDELLGGRQQKVPLKADVGRGKRTLEWDGRRAMLEEAMGHLWWALGALIQAPLDYWVQVQAFGLGFNLRFKQLRCRLYRLRFRVR